MELRVVFVPLNRPQLAPVKTLEPFWFRVCNLCRPSDERRLLQRLSSVSS